MSHLDAIKFAKNIIEKVSDIEQVSNFDINIQDNLTVKIRIYFTNILFIDVFYNSDTGRTAYNLIDRGKRIYGADNTGKWHIHPFDNPDTHKFCKEILFEDFIKIVVKKYWGKKIKVKI